MSPITTGVKPPIRSRTFTEKDAKDAHAALTEYAANGNTNEGVGYGYFTSAEAARSAGQSLNKMIERLGLRDTKWATTTFPVDVSVDAEGNVVPDGTEGATTARKYAGVMLPKDAKPAPAKKSTGGRRRR
jgi:hypothetical protein